MLEFSNPVSFLCSFTNYKDVQILYAQESFTLRSSLTIRYYYILRPYSPEALSFMESSSDSFYTRIGCVLELGTRSFLKGEGVRYVDE